MKRLNSVREWSESEPAQWVNLTGCTREGPQVETLNVSRSGWEGDAMRRSFTMYVTVSHLSSECLCYKSEILWQTQPKGERAYPDSRGKDGVHRGWETETVGACDITGCVITSTTRKQRLMNATCCSAPPFHVRTPGSWPGNGATHSG